MWFKCLIPGAMPVTAYSFELTFLLPCFVFLCESISYTIGKEEKISLEVPQLSEEETRSNHMPDHLRCDACLAVTHQMITAFENASKRKLNSKLKESEILEILETVCSTAFQDYGVKRVNGENRLSGPGLEAEQVMGMTQMGGKWPHRLQEVCHNYVGETGEMEIYETFITGTVKLKDYMCHRTGLYGQCSQFVLHHKTEL